MAKGTVTVGGPDRARKGGKKKENLADFLWLEADGGEGIEGDLARFSLRLKRRGRSQQ